MKIVTILGARPQFIKAAAVSEKFSEHFDEIVVHTGQHYDSNMSDVFFDELNIRRPKYNLGIGSGMHGTQTGAMLAEIEKVLVAEQPDFVMVYGDTNSTLAGALAASKLLIPVIHVEAGLRSFNKSMPEEQNRVLTDHLSSLLFVPVQTAAAQLETEGISAGVHNVGDVMYDGILQFGKLAKEKSTILEQLGLTEANYLLATVHRAENTDNSERLREIFAAFSESGKKIVLPLHPRTKKFLEDYGIAAGENVLLTDPVGYLDMLRLEMGASSILTDSGGVQKEAFFLSRPCITLREETEWTETVNNGWNILTGANRQKITAAIREFAPSHPRGDFFGDGNAAGKMIRIIKEYRN